MPICACPDVLGALLPSGPNLASMASADAEEAAAAAAEAQAGGIEAWLFGSSASATAAAAAAGGASGTSLRGLADRSVAGRRDKGGMCGVGGSRHW
jgi:hypothetical protein